MRNMITGGMSEREARAMLQKRGILAFRAIAGMIPHKTDLIDNLPTFRVVSNYVETYTHYSLFRARKYEMARLLLKCNEPMCSYCADYLELFFQPNRAMWQIRFVPHWNDETCCLCGGGCFDDDIPF